MFVFDAGLVYLDALYSLHAFFRRQEAGCGRRIGEVEPGCNKLELVPFHARSKETRQKITDVIRVISPVMIMSLASVNIEASARCGVGLTIAKA